MPSSLRLGFLYSNSAVIRIGNFMFRKRNVVFPVLLIAFIVVFPPRYPYGDAGLDFILDVFALLLAAFGEAVRVITVGLEYIKRGGLNKQVYAKQLVTGGAFTLSRNPLYIGNLLMVFALLMLTGRLPIFLLGGAVVLFLYVSLVAAEENYLREKFGDEYEAYCQKVARWLPNLRGVRGIFHDQRFNWRRVLLKENSNVYAWIVAAFLVDGIAHWRAGDFLESAGGRLFIVILIVATAAFAAIRVLKKTGRLKEASSATP